MGNIFTDIVDGVGGFFSDVGTTAVRTFTAHSEKYSDIVGAAKISEDELAAMSEKKRTSAQAKIDRANAILEAEKTQSTTWNDLMETATAEYNNMYEDSLSYLEASSHVTDAQWDEAYNASVSDNYATGDVTFGDGASLSNVTLNSGDDHMSLDWSEMQTMKKTQLSDGKFVTTTECNFDWDDEIGETKEAAGGTITYLGTKNVSYDRNSEKFSINPFDSDAGWAGTAGTTKMVHYEGYLGSFDYDASQFVLGYWTCQVGDEEINVPVLHYNMAGRASNLAGNDLSGFRNGNAIHIPKGLEVADYMFAGTGIKSMPDLTEDGLNLKSAHCMFMGCTDMTTACSDAKNASGAYEGRIQMPSSLEDVSWMFAGCTNMQDYFGNLSNDLKDARYAFSECKLLGWDGKTLDDTGKKMVNSFDMPDMTTLRMADEEFLRGMFDGCDASVIKAVRDYVEAGGTFDSAWTREHGEHNNNYDFLIDGSYDADEKAKIKDEAARSGILRLIDKDSKGLSGVASDTLGMADYGTQITKEGTLSDNSVWTKFRQSDFEATFDTDNQFGDILNRAIPAVGTYAISKSLLNNMTNGEHKGIATIGAVALAAVPQIIGVGNTFTPMLDWTANAIGKDTKAGQFLTTLSNKLKGSVTYNTAVTELNADETFETLQDSAVKYAANQMNQRLLANKEYEGEDTLVSTKFDISADMKANGKNIAHDANLLFIACEPEENLKLTMSDSIMGTSLEALRDKMTLELTAAGSDTEKLKEIRDEYSSSYMTLLSNLNAYDDAALAELQSVYGADLELKGQVMNGLEKLMRTTTVPLYTQMAELQTEFKEKYGMDFLTDRQLNAADISTAAMDITGIGTFNEFDFKKDYTAVEDPYVQKLETHQTAFANAIANASSQEEIDAAYASYYETAYGWALDEAEKHGVVLDKRGAQTTSEKNSFSEQLALLETAKKEELESGKTSEKETDIIETKETQTEKSAASEEVINDTDSQEFMSEKRTVQAEAAGFVTESPDTNIALSF